MAIDVNFFRMLDRFQLAIKKKVHSNYQGLRESSQFGQGLVFKDYREYVPGDDTRYLDWRVYARTGKFFIKRFEEERNLMLHIIVDASGSMNYGENVTKFEYASMVGLGFAYMAMSNNEKFIFNTFTEIMHPFRSRKGVNQLMNIVDYLNKLDITGKSKFKESLESYKSYITTKSLIVIISDFLYDTEELKDALGRYRKSQLFIIQVLDPGERKLNLHGDLLLEDAELGVKLRTFISRRLAQKYSDKMETHIAKLKELSENMGAEFLVATTDTPIYDTFFQILKPGKF
ncbi:MAG: DUF58 domain-containing protein [Nanoarchaeota archaeon]